MPNAEIQTLLERIERNARLAYEASTFTSLTQARLRSIMADAELARGLDADR